MRSGTLQLPRRAAIAAILCAAAWGLAACSEAPGDPAAQVGPNPPLPEPHEGLLPSTHVPTIIGWKEGEKPTVAPGLKIEAIAKGLEHPRSLYFLPNGDVLIVESKAPPAGYIRRPKDLVMQWIESQATSGGKPQKSNRNHAPAQCQRRRWPGDPQRPSRRPRFTLRGGAGRQ